MSRTHAVLEFKYTVQNHTRTHVVLEFNYTVLNHTRTHAVLEFKYTVQHHTRNHAVLDFKYTVLNDHTRTHAVLEFKYTVLSHTRMQPNKYSHAYAKLTYHNCWDTNTVSLHYQGHQRFLLLSLFSLKERLKWLQREKKVDWLYSTDKWTNVSDFTNLSCTLEVALHRIVSISSEWPYVWPLELGSTS